METQDPLLSSRYLAGVQIRLQSNRFFLTINYFNNPIRLENKLGC